MIRRFLKRKPRKLRDPLRCYKGFFIPEEMADTLKFLAKGTGIEENVESSVILNSKGRRTKEND